MNEQQPDGKQRPFLFKVRNYMSFSLNAHKADYMSETTCVPYHIFMR